MQALTNLYIEAVSSRPLISSVKYAAAEAIKLDENVKLMSPQRGYRCSAAELVYGTGTSLRLPCEFFMCCTPEGVDAYSLCHPTSSCCPSSCTPQ